MPHDISRREFNRAAATLPLVGVPFQRSDVSNPKSLCLQVQCHRICVDGQHLGGDDWCLEFIVKVVQRKKSDPRYWYGRFMVPTDEFIQQLNDNGFYVVRNNSKRLSAERVTLPNSVAGLCLGLEAAFPADQQDELWTDPTPERWGEYVVPDKRVVKKFWIGEVRT